MVVRKTSIVYYSIMESRESGKDSLISKKPKMRHKCEEKSMNAKGEGEGMS